MPGPQTNLSPSLNQEVRLEQSLSQEQRLGLEILQKNSLELQQEISQRILQNPMLVELQSPTMLAESNLPETMAVDEPPSREEQEFDQDVREYRDQCLVNAVEASEPPSEGKADEGLSFDNDPVYLNQPTAWTSDDDERRQHFLDSQTREPGFLEVLLAECRGSIDGDEHFREICEKLCLCINGRGYLEGTDEELCEITGANPEELQRAIHAIQQLDPPGIGARSLQECLLLQLRRMRLVGSLEWEILTEHLDDLAHNRLPKIAKEMKCDLDEIQETIERIRQLNPNPGGELYGEVAQTVVPEVIIDKDEEGNWRVTSNKDAVSVVALNAEYLQLLVSPDTDTETKKWLREKTNDASMFMHALHLRQETIVNVATVIVRLQWKFFESGDKADLVPMKLETVADQLQLSESTISRAMSGKYMRTPHGTLAFKDLFTTGVSSENGDVSTMKIRSRIREMVDNEDPRHPISDQDISDQLRKEGYAVARRTVAKYRDIDGIPTSSQRKQHA